MDGITQAEDDPAKVKSGMDYFMLSKKVIGEEDDELGRVLEEARAVEREAREVEREVAARQVALLHAVGRATELRNRLCLAQRAVEHREALLASIHEHVLAFVVYRPLSIIGLLFSKNALRLTRRTSLSKSEREAKKNESEE